MSIEQTLLDRSNSKCELCSAEQNLSIYEIPPVDGTNSDKSVMVCDICKTQIEGAVELDTGHHWRCLNDSMWSQVPAVQVMAWRMLNRLKFENWAQDMLDMLYLDDNMMEWAKADGGDETGANCPTLDSNGAILQAGDTVTLIKDLVVKGANFTAKRGTAVRNISLTGNPEQIEGRVNGTRIVLLTCFLKKST
jgi:protein PhnA